jgi:hypothetical protein
MENNRNFGADDDHNLDGLFRESLNNHEVEPSSGVWKGISRRLMWKEIARFNLTNITRIGWIGGTSVAVVIGIATYFLIKTDAEPAPSGVHETTVVLEPAPVATVASPVARPSSAPAPVQPHVSGKQTPAGPAVATSSGFSQAEETPVAPEASEPKPSTALVSTPSAVTLVTPGAGLTTTPGIRYLDVVQPPPDLTEGVLADTLRLSVPGFGDRLILREKTPVPNFFSAGLSVSPEVSFYRSSTADYQMNGWLNLEATYHISRFSIASGVSVGYVSDQGNYRIDYRSRDSVGYYESVTGFTVNPDNPQEIIYTTELMNVYDSLYHVADDRTQNRFTYIQIPLLFGYRFFETSRLGLTLQAGPAVSFLTGRREAEPYINYPHARIIRITDNTPARTPVSWQLWLSVRVDYQITKQLSLFAEPTYKYSFRVYEPNSEGKTTGANSIGLGIGIQYNFGNRNKR